MLQSSRTEFKLAPSKKIRHRTSTTYSLKRPWQSKPSDTLHCCITSLSLTRKQGGSAPLQSLAFLHKVTTISPTSTFKSKNQPSLSVLIVVDPNVTIKNFQVLVIPKSSKKNTKSFQWQLSIHFVIPVHPNISIKNFRVLGTTQLTSKYQDQEIL